MREIWKFVLPIVPRATAVEMPSGAKILSVQVQADQPTVWALVNPSNAKRPRVIITVMTGQEKRESIENLPFIGTVQLGGGGFVLHVFDGGEQC